jgi:hypothetical protein
LLATTLTTTNKTTADHNKAISTETHTEKKPIHHDTYLRPPQTVQATT